MLRIDSVIRPKKLDEALGAISKDSDLKPIAGGTDLMVQLQDSCRRIRLMDISGILELGTLRLEGGKLFIGANLTHAEIAMSELVREYAPLLAQSSAVMGGPAIRNRATIGGNVANSSPVAESFPTLIAHGAEVVLISLRGERRIAVEDFHLGPGKNAMEPDEIILGFDVPAVGEDCFGFYERLGSRAAMTITKVGVALAAKVKSNRLEKVRIALSAVAPRVIRAPESEKILESGEISPELIARAAKILVTECTPISDFRSTCDYREDMVGQLFRKGMANF
ncbi:MAG TPA: xanthine dehydrogenase family protein subunit M [candidate division Zixibacteria bacterium]|nr:xanthine dehydrogenase family protein subunit M [candidate division Zixibacteria bacterium]